MLEKPAIPDEEISRCLLNAFGLRAAELDFLPLGADVNTAVYRATAEGGQEFFVKLRGGEFNPASVAVPWFLGRQGFRQAIAPLPALMGGLWADLPPYRVILSPYVRGRHAYERKLSEAQWREFGAALKQFHTTHFPAGVTAGTPSEDFSPRWREAVRGWLERIRQESFREPAAEELADTLRLKEDEIRDLIEHAEQLARRLRSRPGEFILCHGDIHGWNLLIEESGRLYIVDWDTLVLAPRERDLMFIGAGLGESGYTPQQEEQLFYQGYGGTEIDREAIAYYRTGRILEDIAAYCEQVFLSDEGGEDRRQAVENVRSNFLPGGTVERARFP